MFWWKISSLQIAHESIYQMRSHQNRIYCVISFEFSCYQHLMWYFARQAIEFGVMFPVADCMAMHLLRACIWQTKYMNLKTRIFSDTIVSACSFECIQSNKRKKKKILLEVIFCVVMHLSYAKIINFGNSNDTNDDHHFHCFYVKYHRKTYDFSYHRTLCASMLITILIIAWSFWVCFSFGNFSALFRSYQKSPITIATKYKLILFYVLVQHLFGTDIIRIKIKRKKMK